MTRLFDSQAVAQAADVARKAREDSRKRAEEADEALKELKETDDASQRLRSTLSQAQSVTPIRYEEYRRRGSRWLIEHSRVGEDYIFQLHPLKPPTVTWKDVMAMAIPAMDAIFPRSLKIQYVPPNQQVNLQVYTIKVNKLVELPGWSDAVDRALVSLSAIDAWIKQSSVVPGA